MNRTLRRGLVAVLATATLYAISTAGSGQDIAPVPKIDKVGPIKPIGPIGPIRTSDSVDDPEAAKFEVSLVCWTSNINLKDQKWICTDKYEQSPRLASEFAYYKLLIYPPETGGAAFMKVVLKADWDDPEARKKIIKRIETEVIPAYVKRKTGKELQLVKPDWVDVKPVLSEKQQKAYKERKVLPEDAATKAGSDVAKLEGIWDHNGNYKLAIDSTGGFRVLDGSDQVRGDWQGTLTLDGNKVTAKATKVNATFDGVLQGDTISGYWYWDGKQQNVKWEYTKK